MADDHLLAKVHGLSDLELAALLCLLSREHCLISTPPEALDDLIEELQLISTQTFGLRCAVVHCHPETTLDDFTSSILVPTTARASSFLQARHADTPESSYFASRSDTLTPQPRVTSFQAPSPSTVPTTNIIANVVIAKNLNAAPKAVQIQALELLRTRRIFTRTSVQQAPKKFLFVAALAARSGGAARVTPHLNDFFYLAHWHDPNDGFANLDEAEYGGGTAGEGSETASMESVVKKSSCGGEPAVSDDPLFSDVDIATLAKLSREVQVDVDVFRYQMNIISFLRIHRAVRSGVSPTATKHFEQLIKALAPLHGLNYATPALVALALKKTYLHRIQIVRPEEERSIQWGSQVEAVKALLDGVGPEEVMDDVLEMVPTPL
ncbi:hypothetical protein SODALDRAFT_327334 [Sodiomyces alkalinus F11]|uniref:magnesium chelatase n=1 Tax=Sodiomyces alkalinus (strain CBS 110278 / VKM F-3762 / F11) TaxID=1314773 RepID=A0A3N2Q8S9_SODAK|nr:hypothetical protein SODALDRAFT_327334 [Sodiomyces alkalinus F11]ROT43162.1 hypothetical protein SODALDRAFT_327334 [Sodiomyces alkalinus F11]